MSSSPQRIAAGTDVDLARVPLGVAARAGTPKPDVSTVDAFKQVLLKDLFPRLGIAEKISVKVAPRGTDATGMVATGGADLAVLPGSEIVHAVGVAFACSIAPEIQFVQLFSAAVVAGSRKIEGSKRLIEFLASARASAAIRNRGMEARNLEVGASCQGCAKPDAQIDVVVLDPGLPTGRCLSGLAAARGAS